MNFDIELGDKVGLVGLNGAKKSTLANIIYSSFKADNGERMNLALINICTNNPDFLILDEPTNHIDYQGMQWLIQELKKYKGTLLIISHDRYFFDSTINKIIEIDKGKVGIYYGNYSFTEKKEKEDMKLILMNIEYKRVIRKRYMRK